MQVKWKIALYGSERKKIEAQKLHYSVQEFGRQSELIDLETMWNDLLTLDKTEDCVYLDGPIRCTLLTRQNRPNWIPGSWHDPEHYRCMTYYAHWGKYITQQHYAFLPLGEVYRRRDWIYEAFGKDGQVFLRPDYGEKLFTGQVVAVENFKDFWVHQRLDVEDPRTICVVGQPKEIVKEYRLVMLNGKVMAGSLYAIGRSFCTEPLEEQEDKEAIIEFAETVAKDNPPALPRCYVMDIAKEPSCYSVLEIGCVAAAGFYDANLVKVAEAISTAAEQDWEEHHAE
jgi:hypothetical protein